MAPEGHDSEPEDFAFTLPPLRGQRFTCTVGEDGMITGLPLVAGTVVLVVVP